jgi:hypothetical protein
MVRTTILGSAQFAQRWTCDTCQQEGVVVCEARDDAAVVAKAVRKVHTGCTGLARHGRRDLVLPLESEPDPPSSFDTEALPE